MIIRKKFYTPKFSVLQRGKLLTGGVHQTATANATRVGALGIGMTGKRDPRVERGGNARGKGGGANTPAPTSRERERERARANAG